MGASKGVAVLDPRCRQESRSDFVAVHGESLRLATSLELRSALLRVAVREKWHMAHFLTEHFLTPRRGASGPGIGRVL